MHAHGSNNPRVGNSLLFFVSFPKIQFHEHHFTINETAIESHFFKDSFLITKYFIIIMCMTECVDVCMCVRKRMGG